jgi:cytochrome c peroxidase
MVDSIPLLGIAPLPERRITMRTILAATTLFVIIGCKPKGAVEEAPAILAPISSPADPSWGESATEEINPRLLRRFQPVGDDTATPRPSAETVTLGRALFHDKRLSRNRQIACNSCHPLDKFGIDGLSASVGVDGQQGGRNAPTVFNAATHVALFWDGRAANVEQQATGPILDPAEMAMPNEQAVVAVLESIPGYVEMFRKAFPGKGKPVSLRNVGEAIGAFERGLVTTSRWDRFIAGDMSALTSPEKHGLRVFLDVGCMACHTGPQVGGSMFQKVGAVIAWPNRKDTGRIAITKAAADQMVFKVPSLKNIARTAPYFHDGSAPDLATAIRLMGHHQLGIELADDEVKAISVWMHALTGEIDAAYIAAPELPKNETARERAL